MSSEESELKILVDINLMNLQVEYQTYEYIVAHPKILKFNNNYLNNALIINNKNIILCNHELAKEVEGNHLTYRIKGSNVSIQQILNNEKQIIYRN